MASATYQTRNGNTGVVSYSDINLVSIFDESIIVDIPAKRERCTNCYGSGWVECPCCEARSECPECDGTGWFYEPAQSEVVYPDELDERIRVTLIIG